MRILLEIIISNLDPTDTATVAAAVAALTAETSDGVLSDPVNTFGVVDIPTATTGTITTSPLTAASASHYVDYRIQIFAFVNIKAYFSSMTVMYMYTVPYRINFFLL